MAADASETEAFLLQQAMVAASADGGELDDLPVVDDEESVQTFSIKCQFQATTFVIELTAEHTVLALKTRLASLIKVHPKQQKLVGLKLSAARPDGRKNVADDDALGDCVVSNGMKLIVVGTPEEHMFIDAQDMDASLLPTIVNDFAGDFDLTETVTVRDEAVLSSLREVQQREIRMLAEPRPGKGLLVLDLDYTLLDTKNHSSDFRIAMRPFLHSFLELVYKHYDLVIWSQTRWTWLEMKVTEMGMLMNPNYRLLCTLDVTHMFTVTSLVRGEQRTHHVKPLEILWARFPQYSAANTLHIDDLSRNFALNVGSGIKCRAYKHSETTHATDNELPKLALYLAAVADKDLRDLDHSKWRKVVRRLRRDAGDAHP